MKCPHCQTDLLVPGKNGDPRIRNNGLLVKSSGIAFVCPNKRCGKDVPATQEVSADLMRVLVLFSRPRP